MAATCIIFFACLFAFVFCILLATHLISSFSPLALNRLHSNHHHCNCYSCEQDTCLYAYESSTSNVEVLHQCGKFATSTAHPPGPAVRVSNLPQSCFQTQHQLSPTIHRSGISLLPPLIFLPLTSHQRHQHHHHHRSDSGKKHKSPGALPIPGHLTPSPRSETFSCQGSTNAFAQSASAHSQSLPLPAGSLQTCFWPSFWASTLQQSSSSLSVPAPSAGRSPLRLLHTLHRDLAIAQLHNGVLVVPCGFLPNARHLIQLACSPPGRFFFLGPQALPYFIAATLSPRALRKGHWPADHFGPESSHQANLGPPLASR